MNERTTLEIIAPTVEEAIAQGHAQLGLTADAVSVEVLDAGNKGFFGLGKPQVRVRLTVVPPAGTVVPSGKAVETKTESVPAPKPEPKRVEAKPEPVSVKVSEPQPEHDALLDHTEAVVSRLLHLLKLEAQVSAHYGEAERDGRRSIHVDIRGNDLSVLIGRRTETLTAFQYVASLILGKETEQFVQLTVDVEGYRDRRQSLSVGRPHARYLPRRLGTQMSIHTGQDLVGTLVVENKLRSFRPKSVRSGSSCRRMDNPERLGYGI